jgi:hypothetical protein
MTESRRDNLERPEHHAEETQPSANSERYRELWHYRWGDGQRSPYQDRDDLADIGQPNEWASAASTTIHHVGLGRKGNQDVELKVWERSDTVTMADPGDAD